MNSFKFDDYKMELSSLGILCLTMEQTFSVIVFAHMVKNGSGSWYSSLSDLDQL